MFGFLKDKLKKTVEKFSKEVDEETDVVVPTEEQKEEIIEEIKKEKGFFAKLKDKFSKEEEKELVEEAEDIIEEEKEVKKEGEETEEKVEETKEGLNELEEKEEEIKDDIKEEKEKVEDIKEEVKDLKKKEKEAEPEEKEDIKEKIQKEKEKEEELKKDIKEQEEKVDEISKKIEEGEKEIDELASKQEELKEKEEKVEDKKKGFFAKLKDKFTHKKEEKIEEPEKFEAAGEELKEFEDAFKETEKEELETEEEDEEEVIPVVTEEEGETKFELREKPTAVPKNKKEEKSKEKEPVKEDIREEKEPEPVKEKPILDEEPEEKGGIFAALKDTIFKTSISEEKFEELFWDLEVVLLENNVAVEVIDLIKTNLKKELVQKKILRGKVEDIIIKTLQKSVDETFSVPQIDFIKKVKEKQPFVIVFVGINGSGKTTTIAKMVQKLKDNKLSCVIAAADTFRAAAIQQLEEHANKLKVKMIKHDYGSDPAAVGFDAIKYAKAHNVDCVLIDTAGRLHSNTNLMDEMKKIIRVTNPDLKLFIGEAITGNDCVEQARRFNETIGIDGIILAKADVDDKGGAALSVSYVTQKPILYFGTGQEYKDLEAFDKGKMLERLGLA